MKKSRCFIACILFLFAGVPSLFAQQSKDTLDPDLPVFSNSIDKEIYLKNRETYNALKRGIPYNSPTNPRLAAIAEKNRQESLQSGNPGFVLSAPNWVAEGPFPIPNGQTTGASVAVSGRVTAIAVHPSNANIVYAGTANGGIYRTVDGGV